MRTKPGAARALRAFAVVCGVLMIAFGWPSTASAHTDFESSSPADGTTVDGPLSTVTVSFTNPAVESGDGFELLLPNGVIRTPELVDPTDGTSFIATFTPPLEAGTYAFRWNVQAGDAHPIDGSFEFTVITAAVPPTAAPSTPIATPTTAVPAVTEPVTSTIAVAADAATPTSAPTETSIVAPSETIDEFLAHGGPNPLAGRVARTITMGSTMFAVGVVAALIWVVRGTRDEILQLLGWVRLAGLGLVTGGIAAFAALDEIQSVPRSDLATSKPGIAAVLTVMSGVLVLVGFRPDVGAITAPARSLSAAGAVIDRPRMSSASASAPGRSGENARWRPDGSAAVGFVGLALTLAAYWFDGHTVSRGPWAVHALINLVHVGSAAVWVGGVFAITILAGMRKRRRTASGLAAMVVRFSSIAAISLTALSIAGIAMAWLIVGPPGEVIATSWGKVLAFKLAAVAIAAGFGAYNHFALRPKLVANPDDPDTASHLRVSLLIESAAMLVVIVATSVLVASAT